MSVELQPNVLDESPFSLEDEEKSILFKKDLLEALCHHYVNNRLYQKFCDKHEFVPSTFNGSLEDIPAIPVHIFKAIGHKLSSVDKKLIYTHLESSATTGTPSTVLLDKITSRRQSKAMIRVMQEVLGRKRRPFLIMDIDPSSPNAKSLGARNAAIKGYLNFSSSTTYLIEEENYGKLSFLEKKLVDFLSALDGESAPLVIFGFTFVLYETVFKYLKSKGLNFELPQGSQVIHIGGWKKLETKRVEKSTFNSDIASVFGIPSENIIDVYGFTEQMGLNYPDCKSGWKHIHAYAEVIVRNESDHTVCAEGQVGLLQFLSPLQYSYPGNVVLTDDLGVISSGLCKCGINGRRFKVIGRAKKAEIRGCGDVMSEKVIPSSIESKQPKVAAQLSFYHTPVFLPEEMSPIEKLHSVFEHLQSKKNWLRDQPIEAIIGLINEARKVWQEDVELQIYSNNGLSFLIDWCAPKRMQVMLDSGLRGQRGHLDSFLPRRDVSNSSLKAMPRGLAAHWLSGNVPLLGMFVLIQSILSKNVNVLKVSAGDNQALPKLLAAFEGLSYTTPGGYLINGDDLLETVGIVYFDRYQAQIAAEFSKLADIRVAWGGREAIEAVSELPKKFMSQDLIFGPKVSAIVIAKEALGSDKAIRKLVRRAATDSSVFDQFACASPHNIFVERGGTITPRDFAERLASAMDKALMRLPTVVVDTGQINKIRAKTAEYNFIGDTWSDPEFRWTVLYSEGTVLDDPTFQRVIVVKAVDSISDVVASFNEDVQTVGLAMEGEQRLDFANQIMQRGVMRCPEIGHMTHFDSPWDGIVVIDRMVRWVSLGGKV